VAHESKQFEGLPEMQAGVDGVEHIDRGRIESGRRADLLLVKGDPTKDVRPTRNIVGVWKAGVPIDRNPVAKMAAESRKSAPGH
jgi:hypothetical protein